MPQVNQNILVWARETAGLSREDAVGKLSISDARGVTALDRLAAFETGKVEPSRRLLVKMAKHYPRPLLTFYMSTRPRKGDRGQDFRTLPADHPGAANALLDALIRDVRARQSLVRSILEDEEDVEALGFIGSLDRSAGVRAVAESIQETLRVDMDIFRASRSAEDGFALLRELSESAGIFVLLIGDLGSHHTAIDLETFRGFALADPIAPFIVVNDRDAKSVWSFTLLHELTHLWLGATGVSGASAETAIERFCNDAAGAILLPNQELSALAVDESTDFETAAARISAFAQERNVSRSMVAYKLYRTGVIGAATWRRFATLFREQWIRQRDGIRERDRQREGGPTYYVVRRHRIGAALINLVRRAMGEGSLTPSKASKVLGVKPTNVSALLGGIPKSGPASATK